MNSINEIKTRFRNLDGMRWIRLSELREKQRIACVDGRHSDCVIGAPGGNIGEFILAATALEASTGQSLSSQVVESLMRRFVSEFGSFYSHTDEHALESLRNELDLETDGVEATLAALQRGPGANADKLRRWRTAIVKPENTGCGHLSLMLTRPDEYGVRRKLVEDVVLAFFQVWWEGSDDAEYVVLHGEHQEQAVVTLDVEGELDDDTLVPTVCSFPHEPSVFIHHRSARFYLLREMLTFMADSLGLELKEGATNAALTQLADQQLHATAGYLMQGLDAVAVKVKPPRSTAS